MHVGRKVRTVIQVTRSDAGSVMGKSTDGCQLVVRGSPPAPLTSYVEVIGVAENENSIRAELWAPAPKPLFSFLPLKPLKPSLSISSLQGAGSKLELLLRLPIPVGLAPMPSLGSASAPRSSGPNLGSRLRRKPGLIWMRRM